LTIRVLVMRRGAEELRVVPSSIVRAPVPSALLLPMTREPSLRVVPPE